MRKQKFNAKHVWLHVHANMFAVINIYKQKFNREITKVTVTDLCM